MKRLVFVVLMVALLAPNFGSAANKIDPLINMMSNKTAASVSTMKAFGVKSVGGKNFVDAFIKVKSNGDLNNIKNLIKSLGGNYRSVIGTILTASLPINAIDQLGNNDAIVYIEAARPLRSKMEFARITTGVADAQTGGGEMIGGVGYTGTGVIVGVADSGIDCDHADFKDGGGSTRILSYWDQNISGGGGVDEIANTDGIEYTGSELADGGACTNSADGSTDIGHGTHVAGIAAGSDETFTGVAPDANLVVVKLKEPNIKTSDYSGYVSTLSTNIADGVEYVFRKAQGLKKPAVVNLSVGTSLGAHDGTSLFESALDGLLIDETTGSEKEGRAIVDAAGNENAHMVELVDDSPNADFAGGIHATIDVLASTSKGYEFLINPLGNKNPVYAVGGTWIDIWLDEGSACTIAINVFDDGTDKTAPYAQMTPVSAGETNESEPLTYAGMTAYIDFTEDDNALNGKQHAIANITGTSTSAIDIYSYDLVFDGTCTGDAWLYFDSVPYNFFTKDRVVGANALGYIYVDGDSASTMTIPATANDVISVGSFADRDSWMDEGESEHDQGSATGAVEGAISTFSSLGPTVDGRYKPEITAPGEPIISTLASTVSASSSDQGDSTHHKLEGTSMSSPHVAGIVALMFDKNGCLTPSSIKTKLTSTADSDPQTGASLPTNTWGYGKVNAVEAIESVTEASCAPDNPGEDGQGNSDGGDDDGGDDDGDDDTGASTKISCNLIKSSEDLKIGMNHLFVAFLGFFGLVVVLYGASSYKKSRSK